MTDPAAPLSAASDADAPSALDRARALIGPQLLLLGRLAELGLEVAEAVALQTRGEAPAGKADPSLAFARVSRAVRLTVMLQSKLVDGLAALEALPQSESEAALAAARADPDHELKARVERIIERTAKAEHDGDDAAIDRLVIEAGDRLDDIDLYGDLLDRPLSEILGRICRDIGLPLDWTRLAEEAWAQAEIGSGRPGAPLAALLDQLQARPQPVSELDEADEEGPDIADADRQRPAARRTVTSRQGRRAQAANARDAPACA